MKSKCNSKFESVAELAARIPDGASLALGGSFLHRGPFALVRELIRQKRRGLEIIKQSPGYDIDILCRAGVVSRTRAGIVAMEGNFGLAPWYRRAIETGDLELEEHSCATLTAGLRASAFGVPFMPCGGIHGSDLVRVNGWKSIPDPYGKFGETYVIPKITPDYTIILANEVSEKGDARVFGTSHWDRIMTRAARHVLVVAERVVSTDVFRDRPELTLVPHFMVDSISVLPRAGWPGSCWPHYEVDYEALDAYLDNSESALNTHLNDAPETQELAHV